MAGRSRPAAVRFTLALHGAAWVILVALPVEASAGHGRIAARAHAGDDTSDVGICSVHLLQTGAATGVRGGLRQQAIERRRADAGSWQSNVKNASLAKEETLQHLHSGHCTTVTCRCHRLHIGGSLTLSAAILFVVTALVLGSFVGCGQGLGHTGTPPKEWYAKRLTAVFAVSALLVLGSCYAVHQCVAGHLEFVHIPKNGGSSIEVAGLEAGFYWGSNSLQQWGYQTMPDGDACSRYHVPPSLLEGHSPYTAAHTFCVTRDPYERAVSEYTFLLLVDWGSYFAVRGETGLFDFPECSTEGLNHFVTTTLQNYQNGRKFIDDCHHLPQVAYIFDKHGRRTCNTILRLEEFPDTFDRLMRKNGYPVSMPTTPQMDSSKVCEGLSAKDLTETTRQLLREVYADDFRLLGYTP